MLNINEFNTLRYIAENNVSNQREISKYLDLSLGTVNSILKNLISYGLITNEYELTEVGEKSLKPFAVDNAIILAAGMSTRFVPISYEKPKGLISVKGEVLIERLIRQLKETGVPEIVVVVGYMMDKFIYLREKYGVKLVVNNEFETKNTHSSIYHARDYLGNTYIVCSDNYYPENMFHRYEYRAFYCSIYLPGTSYVERGFTFDKNNLVIDTQKPSVNQWIMYGHAYYDHNFTSEFKPILERYYGQEGVENMYWETIYAENVKSLKMWGLKCTQDQILEFDSVDELKQFDPDFLEYNRVKVVDNICNILNCKPSEIKDLEIIKKGLNNKSFKFTVKNKSYVYRHPGQNASGVIDRNKEAKALNIAKKAGVDRSLIYIDEKEGWKISSYIDVTKPFDFNDDKNIELLADKLSLLHKNNVKVGFEFDYEKEADKLIAQSRKNKTIATMNLCKEQMAPIFNFLNKNKWQVSLCHNDLYEPNLLLSKDGLDIIDWEFAGDSDIGYDICKLFAVRNPEIDEFNRLVRYYFKRDITKDEQKHLIGCAAVIYYYWYVWALYTGEVGEQPSDYLIIWYDKMNYFRELFNGLERK